MTKLLVMTDLHLTAGESIIGLDPCARLTVGLGHAARMHPDAARLILLGDLTHHGKPEQYAELRAVLETAPWPITYLIGNHDRRAAFQGAFPGADRDQAGFVQSVIDLPEARVICLDTLDESAKVEHAGLLCPDRLAWLTARLEEHSGPAILCMHHLPYDTGFAGMDMIKLANSDAFWSVLDRRPVEHILCGHIHRTITATIRKTSVTTFKSTCHQMPMLLGDVGHGHSVDEPGAYGIVLLNGPDIVIHFEDFTLPNQAINDC